VLGTPAARDMKNAKRFLTLRILPEWNDGRNEETQYIGSAI